MSIRKIAAKPVYHTTKVTTSIYRPALDGLRSQHCGRHRHPCVSINNALGRAASVWTGHPDAIPSDSLFQAEQYLLKAEKEKVFDDDYVRGYLEALMKFATQTRSEFERTKALLFYGRFTYLLKQVEKAKPPAPAVPLNGCPVPKPNEPVTPEVHG